MVVAAGTRGELYDERGGRGRDLDGGGSVRDGSVGIFSPGDNGLVDGFVRSDGDDCFKVVFSPWRWVKSSRI